MKEKEWLKSTDPMAMLRHLGEKASDRKLRLFSCACCRRAWHFVRSSRLKQILPLLEACADGTAKKGELDRVNKVGVAVLKSRKLNDEQKCLGGEFWRAAQQKLDPATSNLGELAAAAFGYAAGTQKRFQKGKKDEQAKQAPIVREIFGNPFRPVPFSPSWRTDTALILARQMYESREFSATPILADALQDAGCDNENILNHLRDASATHFRGCWALDLVLGKE